MNSKVKKKNHICNLCGRAFLNNSALIIHKRVHTGEKPYSCAFCDKAFSQKGHLNVHTKSHTGENLFNCDQCGKAFASNSKLKLHRRVHTGEKPYSCEHCDKAFATKGQLIRHTKSHTGENLFKCGQCNKAFGQKGDLTKHNRVHTGEKPYFCELCDKSFSQKGGLTRHNRVHTGEKPYSCEHCDKAFSERGSLNKHNRVHTGKKPYSCDQCNKAFSESGTLKKHKRVHTGEKSYSCEHCNKAFIESGALTRHKRKHTGEKPYSCDKCEKTFAYKSNLTEHNRTHTKEKPYSCEHCNKSFADKGKLSKHYERKHASEKLYSCGHCEKNFQCRDELDRHMKIKHDLVIDFSCNQCDKSFETESEVKRHLKVHKTSCNIQTEDVIKEEANERDDNNQDILDTDGTPEISTSNENPRLENLRFKIEVYKENFANIQNEIIQIKRDMKKTKKRLENEISGFKAKLLEIEENIQNILRSAAEDINDKEIIKLKEDLVYFREQLNIKEERLENLKTETHYGENPMNDEEITHDGQTMTKDNDIVIPDAHDNLLLSTVVDKNNVGLTNADAESIKDDDTPIIDIVERNLEKELRDIKLKLKEAKYYKTALKEEALTTEANLRNKIDKLKSQIEEKSKENTMLMNKDTKQLKKSLISRMEKKAANVKRKIKKKEITEDAISPNSDDQVEENSEIRKRQKKLTKLETKIENIAKRKSENMKTLENLEKESYQIEMNIMNKFSKYKDEYSPEIMEKLNKLHNLEQQIRFKDEIIDKLRARVSNNTLDVSEDSTVDVLDHLNTGEEVENNQDNHETNSERTSSEGRYKETEERLEILRKEMEEAEQTFKEKETEMLNEIDLQKFELRMIENILDFASFETIRFRRIERLENH